MLLKPISCCFFDYKGAGLDSAEEETKKNSTEEHIVTYNAEQKR